MVQVVAVTVGGSISEKTIETVEGVEGGVGEFAGEGAGGGEKVGCPHIDRSTLSIL
jgi:hypothetical protein